jgi:hypothetical protein
MPRKESSVTSARGWESLLEFEEIDVERIYETVLSALAIASYHDAVDEAEASGTKDGLPEAPDIEDVSELYNDLVSGKKPKWWPIQLDRMLIRIKVMPDNAPPANYGPSPYDPNTKDYGKSGFITLMKSLCATIGVPFEGNIEVSIVRKKDKAYLGGYRGAVAVGTLPTGSKGAGHKGEMDDFTQHLYEENKNKDEMMSRMFGQATNVIAASASAINAMRGVNAAPPWMQNQQQGQDQPFWQNLLGEALKITMQSGILTGGNQQAGNAVNQLMNMPVRSNPSLPIPPNQRALPMVNQTPPEPDLGYDQYTLAEDDDEGEYDGFYTSEEDIVPDEGEFPEDVDEEYEESVYEDPEPSSSQNPLNGRSPQEVAEMMDQWLDQGHDKGEVIELGKKLMRKII